MEELARLVILLLAAALIIALVNDGPGGVKKWARAKFLGRVA